MRKPLRTLATLGWISLGLSACAGTKESVLPQDGPTMRAIYDAHFARMGAGGALAVRQALGPRAIGDGEVDLAGYSRSAHNELEALFPRLPNPTLVMYVFPHLAGPQRSPVPGYATSFTLYERTEYALPGEVPGTVHPR